MPTNRIPLWLRVDADLYGMGRRRWYVLPKRVGAEVVEEGAGADGGPGLVCVCEREEDAAWIADAWNARRGGPR